MLAGYPPEACDQHGTCGIQYVVEADGSVYPCDFYMLDEHRLGNLNENRVAQLDEARVQIKFVERSFALDPSCRECGTISCAVAAVSAAAKQCRGSAYTGICGANRTGCFLMPAWKRCRRWRQAFPISENIE